MGLVQKGENEKQRKRMAKLGFKEMMATKYDSEIELSPPSRDEVVCKHCGFKARYKFVRCPECSAIQE